MIVSCSFCEGQGTYSDIPGGWSIPEQKTCPVCKGEGSVSVDRDSRRCRACRGRGWNLSSSEALDAGATRIHCNVCQGLGWVDRPTAEAFDKIWGRYH